MNDTSSDQPTGSDAATSSDIDLDEFLGVPQKSPRKKWIKIGLAVIGVLLMVLLLSRCFAPEAKGEYITRAVERGDLTVTVSATGKLIPTNEVQVGSEQSGIITQVFVDNNDRVTRGQPLARLDVSQLRDTIAQTSAALSLNRAQVDQAKATAKAAESNLRRLEEVYRLSGGKVPSETELDNARAERARSLAAVRASEASVMQARAQLSSAQTNLTKATIYSPVTGVVLSRQIDPGQTVAASFQAPVLFTIAEDLSAMKLEVQIDEADVGLVTEGQKATFTVDAYPGRRFPAEVLRVDVGAQGDSTATSGAAQTNAVVSYTAVLSVQNPELLLRPGMTATANIVTRTVRNQLLVPNEALRFKPEEKKEEEGGIRLGPPRDDKEQEVEIGRGASGTVYVLESEDGGDQELKSLQVKTGISDGSRTTITSGNLKPGQKVILGQLAPDQESEDAANGD